MNLCVHFDLTAKQVWASEKKWADVGIDDASDGLVVNMNNDIPFFANHPVACLLEELDDCAGLELTAELFKSKSRRKAIP